MMSSNYDNWERLVHKVLEKEHFKFPPHVHAHPVTMLGGEEVPSDMHFRGGRDFDYKCCCKSWYSGTTTSVAWKQVMQLRNQDWFMKGITGLTWLLFWSLMLPLIWNFASMIVLLMMKVVANRLVFASILTGVGCLFIHLFKVMGFDNWFVKGIITLLIGLIFWYLMLPLIWNFAFMMIAKVAERLVFVSLKEWVLRSVGYMFIRLLKVLFWGSENERGVSTKERKMSSEELLNFEPLEIKFPFVLKKKMCCSLLATNKTNNYVAFKVLVTDIKKYYVRPNEGIILPHSTCSIAITMCAQKEAPAKTPCGDQFLIRSVVGATAEDVTSEMFDKDHANVEERMFNVMYVVPGQPESLFEGVNQSSHTKGILSNIL